MNWSKVLTITTGLSGFVTALAGMSFEIEKIPIKPEWKGWIATVFAGITAFSYILKQFIPFLEKLTQITNTQPPAPPPPSSTPDQGVIKVESTT